jgi:hypothetical protein
MRFAGLAFARFARFRRHIAHADLVAFQCASLEEAAARRMARHVAGCARCSTELDRIREDFDHLDRALAVRFPLGSVATDGWSGLLEAVQSTCSSIRRGPAPEVLAAYLSNSVQAGSACDPAALEVLEALLGARAAAAVLDAPERPGAAS